MDNELEMTQTFLPVERRSRQDWPWCKGFIVKGVLYSSQVAGDDFEADGDFAAPARSVQRTRVPLS